MTKDQREIRYIYKIFDLPDFNNIAGADRFDSPEGSPSSGDALFLFCFPEATMT